MIKQASAQDCSAISVLARKLWPHCSLQTLEEEYAALLAADECAVFLSVVDLHPVAFAQCQLRHDYVEGSGSSPVGYLEGIFVDPEYRQRGIARELVRRCEQWAKARGCAEFASDCELTNTDSLRFHLGVGFTEANRVICFIKRL